MIPGDVCAVKKFDLSKPYKTRCGYDAGAIEGPFGYLYGWFYDRGRALQGVWVADTGAAMTISSSPLASGPLNKYDLLNTPEKLKIRGWVNVYGAAVNDMRQVGFHATREIADEFASPGRKACVELDMECVVGQGLTEQAP